RLSVTEITGSNYYEIELDTTPDFNSALKRTLNASSYNSSYDYYYNSVSNLLYGTKYYWRARCAHAADTSGWSAVWNFTTQFTLTAAPTLISPVNGATNIDAQNVTLTWNEIANATSYQYQVSTTSDFSNLVASGATANSSVLLVLPGNVTYYWRVRGSDGLGFSPWSVIWHFSTIINCDDPVYTHQYATDCYSYSWHGETYTETGVYYDTLSTFLGCDSIVALHLTISQSITSTLSATVCESDLPYHYVNGDIDTVFGIGTPNLSVFSFQFSTSHGCDSTVTLHLTISQPVTETVEVNVCENDLPYHYVNGDIDTTFDVGTPNLSVFNFQFSTQYGCDSTVILTLNIRSANHTEFSETACGNYTWNNEVYEESGDYVQTFTNANGCDSVVTLHLTIYPTVTELDEVNVCESDLPYHYVNGDIDTVFGIGTPNLSVFSFQFSTSHGCDSTVTLLLTISQPVTETVEVTVCENDLPYHYVNGDIDTTFEVGTPNLSVFSFQFSTSHGCDSTVILTLNIRTADYTEFAETACGNYTWNNEVYEESGDYVQTFTNAAGCDSVVTLHLTIFTADYADFADNACGSYTWNNEVYEESGDYVQTFTNANGCDSVVTLHLTVYPTVTELVEVTICENDLPYHYVNGDIDTTFEVGTPNLSVFNFQFSTQYGCDSIVSLTLIVNASDTDSIRIVDVDLGDRIRLYPNPTLGKVWMDVQNGVEIQQISIFDLAGREVKAPSLSAQSHSEIDLTDCVRGIYMVRIVTNEGMLVRKITRM
ncbi:MAG: T9SS type A sorting domain-containing protein, partial [Bacteroidales bacterium]|nr:T9SS type A sorting domain-containing protein [Bacteroidales bacterium]